MTRTPGLFEQDMPQQSISDMTREQASARAAELREMISENNRLYYVENAPAISDYDYDMLMNELIAIEKRFPELVTPDREFDTMRK